MARKDDLKAAFWFIVWPLFLQWTSKFVHISQRSLKKSLGILIIGIGYFLFRFIKKIDSDAERLGLQKATPGPYENEKRRMNKKSGPKTDRTS